MRIYFELLKFNIYQFIHYPLEMFASILSKVLTILFMYIFWSLFLSVTNKDVQIMDLVGYFLISEGMADITMIFRQKYGSFLRKGIKNGTITNFIIKPLKLLPATYATVWGGRSISNISSILMVIAGIYIINPINLTSYILFSYFFIISLTISFSINLFEGVLTFYVTEPGGIVNSLAHITRLLSGAFIPLYFFPEGIRKVAELLPFAMTIFMPIDMLSQSQFTFEIFKTMMLGLFWSIFIFTIIYQLWKGGLKKYEAIGL